MSNSGKVVFAAVALSFMTFVTSCGHSKVPAETNLKRYRLTGRVTAVDKPNKSLTVDGDEIPGFMSAMEMPYDVKDASLLEKLAVGDRISSDLIVHNDESWLENIKVTATAGAGQKPSSILEVPSLAPRALILGRNFV